MAIEQSAELRRFWAALAFYSRLPVPEGTPLPELSAASRYFPAVGLLVGGIGAAVYGLAGWGLPHLVAVILSVGAMVLATGALHEDGFADTCDGLGGGWTREDALRIMKDSRLGTYGAVGLVLLLAVKLGALASMESSMVAWTLIAAQTSSRFFAITLTRSLPYAQSQASSKSGGLQPLQGTDFQIAALIGLAPLPLLGAVGVLATLLCGSAALACGRYYQKRLGGYTGDSLGAVQQGCETLVYLAVCV
jgi:adenosylcobinamide-GDP ribazoletransferase